MMMAAIGAPPPPPAPQRGLLGSGLLQAGGEARLAEEVFDVRVRDLSPGAGPSQWPGDVSLRELLGASLVTYDRHLAEEHPLQSKAVYVQYSATDPVTQQPSAVVVPAQLSLDVFADPNWTWSPPVEEEVVEEDTRRTDREEEDRRKLKSSIKGDPILLRAKPPPPPDSYFAPLRQETTMCTDPLAGSAHDAGPSGRRKRSEVQGNSTMSSFLKAQGKDKYARSRLGEIDRILERSEPPPEQPPAVLLDLLPSAASSAAASSAAAAAQSFDCFGDSRELTAHLAMHIRQMPHFDQGGRPSQAGRRGMSRPEVGEEYESEDTALEEGTGPSFAQERPLRTKRGAFMTSKSWEERSSLAPAAAAVAAVRANAAAATAAGPASARQRPSSLGATEGLRAGSLTARRSRAGDATAAGAAAGFGDVGPLPGLRAAPKLRDLDPHVSVGGRAPTQRLHSNWPDGLRRHIARHFYGMSPGQILEEEEKERMRDYRCRSKAGAGGDPAEGASASSDPGASAAADAAAAAGEGESGAAAQAAAAAAGAVGKPPAGRGTLLEPLRKGSPERLALERRLARSVAGTGKVAHGLEIRIKNCGRPGRVVVGRHTERARGREEGASRPTMLLDALSAGHKRMGIKY